MSFSRRIRNIAKTQINAIKERLDRIDADADTHDDALRRAEDEIMRRRAERDARDELSDPTDIRPTLRSPEEIASGRTRQAAQSAPGLTPDIAIRPQKGAGPLSHHYRVLGVEEGSDFSTVQAAYSKLAARCSPERFAEGSEEQKTVAEIRKRVDHSYDVLRDALDATAGRFDKLEL
jgi:hypothetical protein